MKKKLEAELISIAHRILKLKNRAELDQLQQETLKLYEKLSVLKFVEDNFGDVKPTIGYAMAEEKLEDIYNTPVLEETEPVIQEPKPIEDAKELDEQQAEPAKEVEEDIKEEVAEPVAETKPEAAVEQEEKQEEPITDSEPEPQPQTIEEEVQAIEEDKTNDEVTPVGKSPFGFDIDFEPKEATETTEKQKEISFEDFHDYIEPEFVKKDNDAPAPEEIKAVDEEWQNWEPKKEEPEVPASPSEPVPVANTASTASTRSLNDSFGKSINIGLNDRIAFEKHLFEGSGEDLNRVLSQLNTFDKLSDAHNFINDLVKPDYNNWKDKEEYAERFMELVAKKFD
ncbi:hypothetical protein DVK85_04930 [Flavobacterium arcticum]|uniref:Uncharacterized protein n=1 Tax=Flavobacterium arcticum TaxID=1784713 RepID=A0A345HAJ8_9FLAO|nr:hypothetical protein [Flavobacterium arcticum]AXG73608.1 hypothetical protein DVK85_04930 [Flavobacterium arcticum]KAF2506413.1 hypothetical protein E0W72_13230 [Flavobacterium arcticum]